MSVISLTGDSRIRCRIINATRVIGRFDCGKHNETEALLLVALQTVGDGLLLV